MPVKKTKARLRAILSALEAGATYAEAARVAQISYSTIRYWRQKDEDFAEACKVAFEAGTDLIETEARRRAVEGVEKPVGFHQGRHTGLYVRDYSDSLLVLLLKARRPEMYKDQASKSDSSTLDVTGARDALYSKLFQTDDSGPPSTPDQQSNGS